MDIEVQVTFRTPNKLNQHRIFPCQIIVKLLKVQNKESLLKASRNKCQVMKKAKAIRKKQTSQHKT
jgi:hypothetical protein